MFVVYNLYVSLYILKYRAGIHVEFNFKYTVLHHCPVYSLPCIVYCAVFCLNIVCNVQHTLWSGYRVKLRLCADCTRVHYKRSSVPVPVAEW